MNRISNGKTYAIEPERQVTGAGHKLTRGQAVYSGTGASRKFHGFIYRKPEGWYCHPESSPAYCYGGGLMKDAVKSIISKSKRG